MAVSRIESLIKKVKELTFPEMNGKNITISAGMAFARNMEQDILICIKMQILHYIDKTEWQRWV